MAGSSRPPEMPCGILVGEQGGNPIFRTGNFDMIILARLGLADRVEDWRKAVLSQHAEQRGNHHG